MKKIKNHKGIIEKITNWKSSNEEIEKPQMKNYKSINEEIGNPQMKKLKNHK